MKQKQFGFEIRRSEPVEGKKGDWYWRAVAKNGKVVAIGGEGYRKLQDLVKTVRTYVVRKDEQAESSLRMALIEHGRDHNGIKLSSPATGEDWNGYV